MQRLVRRLQEGRESGATIVTFALFMTIILGFIGLGIDGAAFFAKRQHVQTGADAAAFSLAQEYALAGCVEDAGLALTWVDKNVPNEPVPATTAIDEVECGEEGGIPFVRVNASADQVPFFLQAVGATSIRVPASATVEWGSPTAGEAFPLTIAECEFDHALDLNGGAYDGTPIEVWVPNASNAEPPHCEGTSYPAGGFGWLDTDGASCVGQYADAEDGTWVEGNTGNDAVVGCDYPSIIGDTVIIPIFDESAGEGADASFRVVTFASIEIVGIQIQTPVPAYPGQKRFGFAAPYGAQCTVKPGDPPDYKHHCFFGVFRGYVSIEDHWDLGPVDPDAPETLIIRLKS